MKRTVLLYGISGGLLIAGLKAAEYRFLVIDHSFEIYAGLIAVIFAAVGIRLGLTLTKTREVVVEVPVPVPAPAVINQAKAAELGITAREMEILRHIAMGQSTREIAAALFVSENTVKTHASRLFDKMGVRRRTQAVHVAKQLGLIA